MPRRFLTTSIWRTGAEKTSLLEFLFKIELFEVGLSSFDRSKDLIKSLLLTEPDRRPTIREVMNNHWVAQHNDVPNTPLGTSMFFTTKAWDQFREMFRESLQTKRKEHSNVPTLMTLDASKNPLLIKRKINQKSNPENNSHKVL
ncbi:unnamed protein product [Schistosoma mattheei]|uniref:non-specific serine/threonine protein kinase n=1 Tax=Schistosoma mattheei TaxID=31246 RepID=A0A183PTB9_9TREM|nr:unnamed protein product [Schistosoma mattheei]